MAENIRKTLYFVFFNRRARPGWISGLLALAFFLTLIFPSLDSATAAQVLPTPAQQVDAPRRTPTPASALVAPGELPPASATPGSLLPTSALITPTQTLTATLFLTPTQTQTATATPTPALDIYLPVIPKQPTLTPTPSPTPSLPPADVLFCFDRTTAIPDDDAGGAVTALTLADARLIHDLDLSLDIEHPWVGDLAIQLTHLESGRSVTVLDRPSYPEDSLGCRNDDIAAILDDELTLPADGRCNTTPAAIAGIYRPEQALSLFDGLPLAGTWQLTVKDLHRYDSGQLKNWCLRAQVSAAPPPPPTPAPVYNLPSSAYVYNVPSFPQQKHLDCESRVAVDWAAFFGYQIDELDFFYNLPVSDNPDAGFVGDVDGVWGQIPPDDYGVHAEPVAALLRAYGVQAYAHRPLSWDALRAEIAAGRPVYVWTIGSGISHGEPVYYQSRDGHLTVVARYEHTIMAIGYSPTHVTIIDKGIVAERTLEEFLGSWSALGNMAITVNP